MRAATPWGATPVTEHLPRAGPVIVQCWDLRVPPSAQVIINACLEELCYFLPLSEPSEGLGADGLLGRAPRGLREGRERETEKQRPLQCGVVCVPETPPKAACWTLNLPQAFVLLMWSPSHRKPYPLLHPVPACPTRSRQTGCFQLCTRKEVSDQKQVWRGGGSSYFPCRNRFSFF